MPNIISYRGGIRFFNRYGAFRHTVALLTTQSIGKLSPTNARMSFSSSINALYLFTVLIIEKEKGAEIERTWAWAFQIPKKEAKMPAPHRKSGRTPHNLLALCEQTPRQPLFKKFCFFPNVWSGVRIYCTLI